MDIAQTYLNSAIKFFNYYKGLGEKAMLQLDAEQFFVVPNEDSNSIAIIVQHLHGNMLSRWTDFLTTDGEKPWRNRDAEFEVVINNKAELLSNWDEGWARVLETLQSLKPEDLSTIIYIRNDGQTALNAINQQMTHYSYHVGQIVYIAKMLKQSPWTSLTVPKNKSAEFNTQKFAVEKGERHFTDGK